MELQSPLFDIITFITSFLFLLVLFKIVKRWSCNNSTINLPPGPWPFPLIGNIHHVISTLLPHQCLNKLAEKYEPLMAQSHRCLKKLAEKYGPLMHLKLGEVSYIIVSSPEMAKEIMKTNDHIFCDRPNLLFSTIWSYNASDIAFSPYGEHWRQLRKICVLELLSAKRVESFRSIREEEISELVKSIYASEGSVVNLSEKIFSLTCGIIARAAFGKKNKHEQKFNSANHEAMTILGGFSIADLYPSIQFLKKLSSAKTKMEKLQRKVDMILQDIIDEHKSSPIESTKDEDLVDVLIKYQKENYHSRHPLTDDSIKSVIQDVFSGGTDTSATVVLWAMSQMVKNPKVMEEAQAEVRRVFDKEGYVDETELHHLVYLKSVIKETLRLHPPGPLLVPRESREMCRINEYDIPAKTRVIINAWAIGRDPRYWIEAETFKPSRFLNSSIDFKGTDFEYIPFGAGRRMCPGIAFSTPIIDLLLAQLLYHFDWKLPNGVKNEELDMTETIGATSSRKNDLLLIPISRRI